MTSRHLFFKAMREDLRHKIWMIALSSLGSFLTLPVAWLMYLSNSRQIYGVIGGNVQAVYQDIPIMYLELVSFIFREFLTVAGGFVAIAGAIIVGLFGFRYVFHKNMVDTYHSIPVKRRTLFGVCWLSGLLIWLVPFLVCLLITIGMVLVFLAGTPGVQWIPDMLSEICINVLVLTVVFLLVYHLVLIAVMISGNILNTLVSMLILGFGVISIYGLGISFFSLYIRTFYPVALNPEPVIYGSPLFSAGYLLYQMIHQRQFGQVGAILPLLINICIMALLGGLAWFLYKRRASELAEQGVRNKVFAAVLKFLVGLAAGMGGWLVFYLMGDSPGWGVFGALFVEILVFGVMDIIFSMEFKAFFAHKLQMAATAVVCLLFSFCLYGDWLGYDTYLPDKEDIVEIAVYDSNFSNRSLASYSVSRQYVMENLHFQDVDAAYAYLERVTNREKGIVSTVYEQSYDVESIAVFPTRVTLKNGRTYYRQYRVSGRDLDVIWPILSDQGYLETNYMIDRQMASCYDLLWLSRAGKSTTNVIAPESLPEDTMWKVAEAYNKDLFEDPSTVLLGGKILLACLNFERSRDFVYDWSEEVPRIYSLGIDVYDSMEHTIAALEELGYGEWTTLQDPDEVSEIRLYSNIWYDSVMDWESAQNMIDSVREYYGVYAEAASDAGELSETYAVYENVVEGAISTSQEAYYDVSGKRVYLSITDREEIRELMQYINYETPRYWNSIFRNRYVETEICMDGENTGGWYYLKNGELPEKYMQRFEQLFLSLRQN